MKTFYRQYLKRLIDFVIALAAIVILIPVYLFLSIWIALDSRGGVLYKQQRIGINQKPFYILKFRTMRPDADKQGLLTVGGRDARITRVGYYLRKYKLDELPQLINVLKGDMSLVGPRPEVPKYVALYTAEQKTVLHVRPGITDYASIQYADENNILAQYPDAERAYIDIVMPAKLALNAQYINDISFGTDMRIIFNTIKGIFA